MATLVQELTEEGAYDLDADPAVEGANEATWLDADSVSPALARDKKLAVRVQALERAIASRGDDDGGGPARAAALRRAILAPPLRPLRAALADATLSIADAARFLAGAAAARWPAALAWFAAGADAEDDDDDDDCEAPRCLRCAAALLAEHCRAGPFAAAFAGAGGAAALERLRARTDLERTVGDDLAAAAAALAATLEFAALEARCHAAMAAKDAAAAPPEPEAAPEPVVAAPEPVVAAPPVAAASSPVEDLAGLLRAARLGEFEATFAAEKVGVADLIEARDAGDLGDLLADCGLKAGERARLKRELAKLRPDL
jgi:hypothetical protein